MISVFSWYICETRIVRQKSSVLGVPTEVGIKEGNTGKWQRKEAL
jgi:hypothetical protein